MIGFRNPFTGKRYRWELGSKDHTKPSYPVEKLTPPANRLIEYVKTKLGRLK